MIKTGIKMRITTLEQREAIRRICKGEGFRLVTLEKDANCAVVGDNWVCIEFISNKAFTNALDHEEVDADLFILTNGTCEEPPTYIEATLNERGQRYGDFDGHARISQNIKGAMADSPNWPTLSPSAKEALEMIAHKMARVLNGDPTYADSWHDMAGYATLVEKECDHE